MLIDWFTVGAQVLNFIVLVWLLKHFLYQPILDAVDAREARIATQIADAQTAQKHAETQREAFQAKSDRFDAERADLLTAATQAAGVERTRLLAAARQAADDLGNKRQDALEADALQLDRELAERARREVFAISRKALRDLATTSLEKQIAEVFIERLRALDAPARAGLATAMQVSSQVALIRSAFDLPKAQQQAIQSAVSEVFGDRPALRFETAADLVSGIELVTDGQKLAWSIAHHLDSLAHLVSDVVATKVEEVQSTPQIDKAQPKAVAA